jgi:hypothetical protein
VIAQELDLPSFRDLFRMESIVHKLTSSVSFLSLMILLPVVMTIIYYQDDDLAGVPFIGKELGGFRKKQQAWRANGRGMMRIGYLKVDQNWFVVKTIAKRCSPKLSESSLNLVGLFEPIMISTILIGIRACCYALKRELDRGAEAA